jgi:SAM-dependent methyltransferase
MSENAVFGPGYADCYDHFYADKDYAAECDFLEEVFRRYAIKPVHTILDLGCGTGGHALILSQRGYQVTGVDRSEEMLAIAQARAVATLKRPNVPTFQHGDIRAFDLGRTFDALIAMFAVISYQTSNEDLLAAFRAARRHLQPGGLFFFDAWFGPAVLMVRPADRYKVIEENGMRMIRFAHPELDLLRQTVSVHYQVLRLQDGRVVEETDEVHPMRFFFPQEILYYLGEAGFVVRRLCPFLRLDEDISEREWNLAVVVEAV